MDTGMLAQKVSVGSVFGVCTGYAVKRLSQEAAYGAGLGFIFLQALSYYGYIQINWKKVKDDISKAADQDGDGQFDSTDVKIIIKRGISFLSHGIPDAAGFSAGLWVGFRWL
eukprot:CAMPEP_0174828448 /NCGR_PEP_ID=MMETSP1114-20130205/1341_1 /TAXON_ID=312471 /ORGANISM="Neobodo designis, Strain CCAP 1951/1" /LENGTH=111 /DNA_ID=CAMNT_0016062167 /DNA_START=52 /DNA_END=387 /DNA_ORIENTATION=+